MRDHLGGECCAQHLHLSFILSLLIWPIWKRMEWSSLKFIALRFDMFPVPAKWVHFCYSFQHFFGSGCALNCALFGIGRFCLTKTEDMPVQWAIILVKDYMKWKWGICTIQKQLWSTLQIWTKRFSPHRAKVPSYRYIKHRGGPADPWPCGPGNLTGGLRQSSRAQNYCSGVQIFFLETFCKTKYYSSVE